MKLFKFYEEYSTAWDNIVFQGNFGSFLHSRRFISYHGDRFNDESLLLFDDELNLIAIFPAAVDPSDQLSVVSHPGATFGGFVHQGSLFGEKMCEAMQLVKSYYSEKRYKKLIYKKVPTIYQQKQDEDDSYALFRLNAKRIRCDLSASIRLDNFIVSSDRRIRGKRKAEKAGVVIEQTSQLLYEFWEVLKVNLKEKHQTYPVHTYQEIELLSELFPDQITFVFGTINGSVVGGVVLFESPTVTHAQYIASTAQGRKVGVLDAIFMYCIEVAIKKKKRYFDFGISNEQQGYILNTGLYQYKREFGSGGVVHEFFEIKL